MNRALRNTGINVTPEFDSTFVAQTTRILKSECVMSFRMVLCLVLGLVLCRQGLADDKSAEVRESSGKRPNVVMILTNDI